MKKNKHFQDFFLSVRKKRPLAKPLHGYVLRLARCLQDVLEDQKLLRWRCVQDFFKTCLQDVFKTSSRPTNVCWEGSTIDYIYGLLLLSRAPKDSIDTAVLSQYFLSGNIRIAKISYSKKDIFHSVPWTKLLRFRHPIIPATPWGPPLI